MDDAKLPMPIYVVSDGTGETAEKVVRAALRQFRGHLVHVHTIGDVQGDDHIRDLVRKAKA
ncbi:MAG: kinase/pyrophosphorylase, partial [Myxococcota bacterium]